MRCSRGSGPFLRKRRMRIGRNHHPEDEVDQYQEHSQTQAVLPENGERTTRMPTHDSAMLTSRLSWAHFLAAETSFRAKSVRFCCRCIWVIKAMLFVGLMSAAGASCEPRGYHGLGNTDASRLP